MTARDWVRIHRGDTIYLFTRHSSGSWVLLWIPPTDAGTGGYFASARRP